MKPRIGYLSKGAGKGKKACVEITVQSVFMILCCAVSSPKGRRRRQQLVRPYHAAAPVPAAGTATFAKSLPMYLFICLVGWLFVGLLTTYLLVC